MLFWTQMRSNREVSNHVPKNIKYFFKETENPIGFYSLKNKRTKIPWEKINFAIKQRKLAGRHNLMNEAKFKL